MLAPYACGGVGQWDVEPDALKATALRASRAGLGVAVHAIGDAGVRSALDAFEAVRATGSRVPLRVEHAQIVSAEDVPRFAALGVAASMQPVHFLTDRDRALAEWGDRCALAYAWGPLRGAGAQLLFGTDAPIEPLDPWATLAAAVGDVGALQPFSSSERKVSFAVALQAMTEAPWRSLGRAGGTLSPGAPADLILVDRGAAELESGRNIGSTQVLLTLAGGRVAHAAGQFAALRPR